MPTCKSPAHTHIHTHTHRLQVLRSLPSYRCFTTALLLLNYCFTTALLLLCYSFTTALLLGLGRAAEGLPRRVYCRRPTGGAVLCDQLYYCFTTPALLLLLYSCFTPAALLARRWRCTFGQARTILTETSARKCNASRETSWPSLPPRRSTTSYC